MEMPDDIEMDKAEFEKKCGLVGIDDLERFYSQLQKYRVDGDKIIKAL
jgi:hypothetical protein